jgi:cytochrome c-type biogenesis protein CcmH/NrfF
MIGGSGAPHAVLATLLAISLAPAPPAAGRASAIAIEQQVMCVTCKIPLVEANSPQAEREKALIRGLVAKGLGERQIKNALVSEYGPAVLALPKATGVNLAVYIVPPAVVLIALAALAVAIPRWRRRGRERESGPGATAPSLSPADAARLDRDLARFDP